MISMEKDQTASPPTKPMKRLRTTKPCDYCKTKKIRCQFPKDISQTRQRLPCAHCTEFGIICVVKGELMDGSDSPTPTAQPHQPGPSPTSPTSSVTASQPIATNKPEELDALSTGVGMLSLAGSQEARFLGSSSGVTWARLISGTLQREGVLPALPTTAFADPPLPGNAFMQSLGLPVLPPALPLPHLRLYYLDTAYKHIQARYACLDWRQIRRWHEQADTLHQSVASGLASPASQVAAFFLWLVYGYGARMTEDMQLPGAPNHEIYYSAAVSCLPIITQERSLLSVQAQLFLTLYLYRHPTSELSLWRLGGAAFRAVQEIGLHRRGTLRGAYEESRRRTFWTAYTLDRMISMQLGRPFLFHAEDIDIEEPLNIDDDTSPEVIERLQVAVEHGEAPPGPNEVTTMTAFIHSLHLNRIRAKIHDTTYRVGPHRDNGPNVNQVLLELDTWRQNHPPYKSAGECAVQLFTEHWEMEYHHSVQTLLRPLSSDPSRRTPYALRCAKSAGGLCQNQWICIQRDSRNLSASALYRLFLSGVSLIYLTINRSEIDIPPADIRNYLDCCVRSLDVFATQFLWALGYRDCFAQLKTRFESRLPSDEIWNTTESYTVADFWELAELSQPLNQSVATDMSNNASLDAFLRSVGLQSDSLGVWDSQTNIASPFELPFGLT